MDQQKQETRQDQQPPMAELVILVGDSRPVTVIMAWDFQKTGEVIFSNGPCEDVALAQWVLSFMTNAAADELFMRLRARTRDFMPLDETTPVDTDDIPF